MAAYKDKTFHQDMFKMGEGVRAMKIKRLKVGVRPLSERLEEFGGTLNAPQAGQVVPKRAGVYFVSVEAMR
ncbi:MAG: hypothetical protein AB7G48_12490 [Nitrospiraceae bacterium]